MKPYTAVVRKYYQGYMALCPELNISVTGPDPDGTLDLMKEAAEEHLMAEHWERGAPEFSMDFDALFDLVDVTDEQ